MSAGMSPEPKKARAVLRYLRYLCVVCAVGFLLCGELLGNRNVQFWASMWLLAANTLYSWEFLKRRMLFWVFNGTYFLFLMARPLVRGLRLETWWAEFSDASVSFSLRALFVGLLCLQIGAAICEKVLVQWKKAPPAALSLSEQRQTAIFLKNLQWVALALFGVTMVFYLCQELLMLRYMHGRPYVDYYLPGRPSPPFPIGTLAGMMPLSLCVYLSTFPRKKQAFVPLSLYLLSAIPVFFVGVRNPLVLRAVFIFLYYFLRDTMEDPEKWLGKWEKGLVVVLSIPAVLGLSAYNYLRDGASVTLNPLGLLVDFVDKQGVSFKTLCLGYDALPQMPSGMRWYTFGWVLDDIGHGALGQRLFGTVDLGPGNNVVKALEGHSFAHSMSYVAKPDYLQGHGWGSSFLLEAYADFGWTGIVVFSLLLGVALVWLAYLFHQGWLKRTISLLCLTTLFFVPRAETTSWLQFLLTPHFWLVVGFCSAGALLLPRMKIRLHP